ncbi:hypothetical protein D9M68_826140 [compost metagenome]
MEVLVQADGGEDVAGGKGLFVLRDQGFHARDVVGRGDFGGARGGHALQFQADVADFQVFGQGDFGYPDVARAAHDQRAILHEAQHAVAHGGDAGAQLCCQLPDAQPVSRPELAFHQGAADPGVDPVAHAFVLHGREAGLCLRRLQRRRGGVGVRVGIRACARMMHQSTCQES